MTETTMPATEATAVVDAPEVEVSHYEFAFHLLPTVAEGEVADAQTALRGMLEKAGATIDTEEVAARYDLAYDITKEVDGKNQSFNTAYFGWIRFMAEGEKLEEMKEHIDSVDTLLRYMIVKLTKEDAEHPFKVHEIKSKMPEIVGEEDTAESKDAPELESKTEKEDATEEVKEEELDESLDKITGADEDTDTETKSEEEKS